MALRASQRAVVYFQTFVVFMALNMGYWYHGFKVPLFNFLPELPWYPWGQRLLFMVKFGNLLLVLLVVFLGICIRRTASKNRRVIFYAEIASVIAVAAAWIISDSLFWR